MQPLRKKIVLGITVLIFAYQGWAFVRQWTEQGFRPFGKAPGRVSFSWDMFAVKIERCSVRMKPQLPIGNKLVHRLKDLTPALEWDIVMNRREDYLGLMSYVCREHVMKTMTEFGTHPDLIQIEVQCALSNGTLKKESFGCQ